MSTVLLVIIVVAVSVLLLLKSSSGSGQFSYRRKSDLLSKAGLFFYGVLSLAVGDNALIFPKVTRRGV